MEKDDWSAYLEHKSMKQELEESPANREAQLVFGSEDRFGIYQLKDTEEARDIHFMGMDYLESKGIAVTKENYDLLYTAPLEEGTSLEDIYTRYYVIADLSTWAENSPERSKLERFDSISEAMEAFQAYRGKDAQYSDDKARTTFGVSVHGIEFDVIHVRNNENVLSLDFTHSSEAKESKHFMDDLQTLSDSIGIDKVRVHRDMTPEEVKDFVKQRFEYQLKQGGLDDISLYMSRFDTLYEQGKMEKLMPTANQKHIEENVPITEWDNPYFEVKEPEQMAFSIKDKFVSIQTCTEGYDYSVFDADYKLIDGGVYDNPDISIHAALKDVLQRLKSLKNRITT